MFYPPRTTWPWNSSAVGRGGDQRKRGEYKEYPFRNFHVVCSSESILLPTDHAATDRVWEVLDLVVVLETKSDSFSLTDVGLIRLDLLSYKERTRFEAIRKTELFLSIWLDNNPISTTM
jgi:hypothetical protein